MPVLLQAEVDGATDAALSGAPATVNGGTLVHLLVVGIMATAAAHSTILVAELVKWLPLLAPLIALLRLLGLVRRMMNCIIWQPSC
jgi:hypothetical protein